MEILCTHGPVAGWQSTKGPNNKPPWYLCPDEVLIWHNHAIMNQNDCHNEVGCVGGHEIASGSNEQGTMDALGDPTVGDKR